MVLTDSINQESTAITTFDQKIAEWFNSNFGLGGDWHWGNLILCFLAILLTVICCAFIGSEREKKGRTAGLRTHLLVGVGSCLIMIISIYGFPLFGADRDIARLAAQIVAGVGFLGAGTIILNKGHIQGLTTASTIWLAMAIGLACGSMNFILAVFGTIIVMVVLVGFKKYERKITKKYTVVSIVIPANTPYTTYLLKTGSSLKCKVTDINATAVKLNNEDCLEVIFQVRNDTNDPDIESLINSFKEKIPVYCYEIISNQ